MIEAWCKRKGYSKLIKIAAAKLMDGKYYGKLITTEEQFTDAMEALLEDFKKSPAT